MMSEGKLILFQVKKNIFLELCAECILLKMLIALFNCTNKRLFYLRKFFILQNSSDVVFKLNIFEIKL